MHWIINVIAETLIEHWLFKSFLGVDFLFCVGAFSLLASFCCMNYQISIDLWLCPLLLFQQLCESILDTSRSSWPWLRDQTCKYFIGVSNAIQNPANVLFVLLLNISTWGTTTMNIVNISCVVVMRFRFRWKHNCWYFMSVSSSNGNSAWSRNRNWDLAMAKSLHMMQNHL